MKWIYPLGALSLALSPARAHAITCTIVSVSPSTFGGYDVFSSAPLDTTGNVTFNCTAVGGGDNITVALSTGGSSTFVTRELTGAGGALEYNLYLDAARTTPWGDGTGASAVYGPINPPDGTNSNVSVYGRMPAHQDAPAGTYGDTITVTVNY